MPRICGVSSRSTDWRILRSPSERNVSRWFCLHPIVLRACVRLSTPTPSVPDYRHLNPTDFGTPDTLSCDRACAAERLSKLEKSCLASPLLNCENEAMAATAALAAGQCVEAKSALHRIPAFTHSARMESPLAGMQLVQAIAGLEQACRLRTSR